MSIEEPLVAGHGMPGGPGEKYRPVPWTLRDIVIASLIALGLLLAGIVAVVVVGVLAGFLGFDLASEASRPALILAVTALEAVFVIPAWLRGPRRYGRDGRWLGLRPPSGAGRAALYTVAGLAVILLINLLWGLISEWLDLAGQPDLVPIFGEGPGGLVLALLVAAVVAPLAEEIFFRGFMYPAMRDRWGLAAGVLVSALVFAVFHLQPSTLLPIAAMGAVFAVLYEATGSLWPPIVLHALVNLLGVVGAYASTAST